MNTPSRGAIYVATGDRYVAAAVTAARSLARHCKGMQIHLFTDPEGELAVKQLSASPFTSIAVLENPNPRSKVDALVLTPFDQTIYFDADTKVVADITEVFGLLEKYDIAMAHAMRRVEGNLAPYHYPLPDAFPELNSGVMLYRKTPAVMKMLQRFKQEFAGDWVEIGERNQQALHDQTPLRELLWESGLQIAVLPPEYNIRYLRYPFFWGKTEAQPKIYHLKMLQRGWWRWVTKTIQKLPGIKRINRYWRKFQMEILHKGAK